jgi:hypothetical protein
VEIAAPSSGGDLFSREQPLVMLGLWNRPARMVVIRRGNPLHAASAEEGIYLASLPDAMPGRPTPIKNGTVRVFAAGKAMRRESLAGVGK